jgi:hypothetical protein
MCRARIDNLWVPLGLRSRCHHFLTYCFAVVACFLSDTFTTRVTLLKITYKTDDLIAIATFFRFEWNLLAHHAWYIINKFLLKLIHWDIGISSQQRLYLHFQESALAQDAVYLFISLNKVVAINITQTSLFCVHNELWIISKINIEYKINLIYCF